MTVLVEMVIRVLMADLAVVAEPANGVQVEEEDTPVAEALPDMLRLVAADL